MVKPQKIAIFGLNLLTKKCQYGPRAKRKTIFYAKITKGVVI